MFSQLLFISCALFCLFQCLIFGSEQESGVVVNDELPISELVFHDGVVQGRVKINPGERRILKCLFKDDRFLGAEIVAVDSTCRCIAPEINEVIVKGVTVEIPFLYVAPERQANYLNLITIKYKSRDGSLAIAKYQLSTQVQSWALVMRNGTMHPTIELPSSPNIEIKAKIHTDVSVAPDRVSLVVPHSLLRVSSVHSKDGSADINWMLHFNRPGNEFSGKCYFNAYLEVLGQQADPWLNGVVSFNILVNKQSEHTVTPSLVFFKKSHILNEALENKIVINSRFTIKSDDIRILDESNHGWNKLLRLKECEQNNSFVFVLKSPRISADELPTVKSIFNIVVKLPDNSSFYHPVFYFP